VVHLDIIPIFDRDVLALALNVAKRTSMLPNGTFSPDSSVGNNPLHAQDGRGSREGERIGVDIPLSSLEDEDGLVISGEDLGVEVGEDDRTDESMIAKITNFLSFKSYKGYNNKINNILKEAEAVKRREYSVNTDTSLQSTGLRAITSGDGGVQSGNSLGESVDDDIYNSTTEF
jgi:hypothetical protein